MRPGVGAQERNPLRHAAFELHLQRMIGGIANRLVAADIALPDLVWTARIDGRLTGNAGVDQLDGPIQIFKGDDQLGALGTHITRVDNDVAGQLFLYVEIPLLDVAVAHVGVVRDGEVQHARSP